MRPLSMTLILLAGCGRFGFDDSTSRDYRFTDSEKAQFDQGVYDVGTKPLVYRDGKLQFAIAPPYAREDVGIYVSRVFDTGDPSSKWHTLAWTPPSPHGRALASSEGDEPGYAEGSVSMASNILLLHLDGTGDATAGARVADASGKQHDGDIVQAGQGTRYTAGVFGSALDIDRDAWVHLDGNYFDYGTGDFTYAIWVKNFDCSQSNDNRVAIGGGGTNDDPHVWLGASCPEMCPGGDGAHATVLNAVRAGTSVDACSGVVLHDGNWHHLALVKRGHSPALLALFVDGMRVATQSFDYGATPFTYDGGEIRLGSFNLGDPLYNTRIVVDEAAIWKRALDDDSVASLYRRGALRAELQFRVCSDGACDNEPFVGPDGTPATYFTELELRGAAGSQANNLAGLGLAGALAQYRVRFSTTAAQLSPSLLNVTVAASP